MATRTGGKGSGGTSGKGSGQGGRGGPGDDPETRAADHPGEAAPEVGKPGEEPGRGAGKGTAPRAGKASVPPARAASAARGTAAATRNRARGGETVQARAKGAVKEAVRAIAKVLPGKALPGKAPSGRAGTGRPGTKPEVGQRPVPQETGGRVMALDLPRGDLSPEMRAYFAKCEEKLGYIPNVLAAYAHDTAKLEAFAAMYNDLMLAPSGLSKLEREMIAVAVSSVNRCYYCLTAHGAAVRQLSGDPVLGEMLVMNYRAADLSPRHRAMLDFAVQLTEAPDTIEAEDREMLREAGLSERDVWDVAATASFFNMSNRMAAAVDMRPNRSYHGDARALPDA